MILDRMHYVSMGWWRWSKVRLMIFVYRLSGGERKAIGLNQQFQLMNLFFEQARHKPILLSPFNTLEMEAAQKICPVDAISEKDKKWKVDTLRCNSCHLCIKVAPKSLQLSPVESEEIVSY